MTHHILLLVTEEFRSQTQALGFHRSRAATHPNTPNKEKSRVKGRERRFILWHRHAVGNVKGKAAFQPMLSIQTFPLGVHRRKN
jgi:hypothetical protein